ncbi:death-associated protein-like 1 isoform X2 [Felis catus]|uniref:death-associated protein-like 1 isoform X2 n=1 Tax=Felis catus TaxID=9685 RepID=UPI001D1A2ECA|nr:death-associated protein-like 1 isoform X2 [Felis catus]
MDCSLTLRTMFRTICHRRLAVVATQPRLQMAMCFQELCFQRLGLRGAAVMPPSNPGPTTDDPCLLGKSRRNANFQKTRNWRLGQTHQKNGIRENKRHCKYCQTAGNGYPERHTGEAWILQQSVMP